MTRITVAAAIVITIAAGTAAHAQQSTIYDTRTGKIVGREVGSGNATTIYDSSGRVSGRTSTGSSGTTTIFDADGRRVGTINQQKREKP